MLSNIYIVISRSSFLENVLIMFWYSVENGAIEWLISNFRRVTKFYVDVDLMLMFMYQVVDCGRFSKPPNAFKSKLYFFSYSKMTQI